MTQQDGWAPDYLEGGELVGDVALEVLVDGGHGVGRLLPELEQGGLGRPGTGPRREQGGARVSLVLALRAGRTLQGC